MRRYLPDILEVLDRRSFARANFLLELVGGSAHRRRADFAALTKAGLIVRHPPNGDGNITRSYPMYFHRIYSKKRDARPPEHARGFWHQVMIDDLMIAVEIYCKKHGLTYTDGKDILQGRPMRLSSAISYEFERGRTETYDRDLLPDGLFAINDRYFVLEADRDTEDVHASTFKQKRSWLRTLLQYRDVLTKKTYAREWGIPNLTVLVATINEAQRRRIVNEFGDRLSGQSKALCFAVFPTLADTIKAPTPDLDFDNWERVGHPPFSLKELG